MMRWSACPVEREDGRERSRWRLHRARLRGKWPEAVTLELVSCLVKGESGGGDHVGCRIVPGWGEKWRRGARWRLYRARLRGKWAEAVTLEVVSCPVERESCGGGHDGCRIVPG